jgi:hypothetical protein
MAFAAFRIESKFPLRNRLLPDSTFGESYQDMSVAVAIAVKSAAVPVGQEIKVVHVPSGEVVFRTASGSSQQADFDA